jgi:alpha/beta superfamily hydrolase
LPEVIINGPEGRIEARYHQSPNKTAPIALVLHPHPLHGGTMNNKVVYNMYHSFARNGFSVLRFNFRGVGRSEGKFDNGIGELTDAATTLDWLQIQNPNSSNFWIAGFSFGSWVGLHLLMRRPELENFIAVSPPAGRYDFNFLSPCPSPGLILQGDKDSVVPEEEVAVFAEKISKQRGPHIDYRVIAGADHFYRDKIDELTINLDEYISTRLKEYKPKKVKRDRRRRKAMAEAES